MIKNKASYLQKTVRLVLLATFSFLVSVCSYGNTVHAATINLDSDFNGTGYVTHNGAAGGNSIDVAYSAIIDNNGKYVMVGASTNSAGNQDIAIWRYNENGTLDTTFNGVGYAVHSGAAGGTGTDNAISITVDHDGKYLVVGTSTNAAGNGDMAIWRYNADGTLDITFGGVGYITQNGAAGGIGADLASFLVIDSNGRYVVSGYSTNAAGNMDMAIWRYNANGTLDTTFNGIGFVTNNGTAGGNGNDVAYKVQIDNNGKYVISGYSYNSAGNADMTIWRYNSTGTPDTTYNGVGYTTNNAATGVAGHEYGLSITLDHDGKYVVCGYGPNANGNDDVVVWRYNTDGTLDTTFNDTGIYTHGFSTKGNLHDRIAGFNRAIYIDENNKIVFATYLKIAFTNADFAIVRLNPNGTLDTTLNGTGFVYFPSSIGDDLSYAINSDGKGKYVVAGYMNRSNIDMGVVVALDYPHSISTDVLTTYYRVNSVTLTGNVAAPKSTTSIKTVDWSLTKNSGWNSCIANDGTFDSLSENFTCTVSGLSEGSHNIYVRSCDEFGSCTYQANIVKSNDFVVDTKDPTINITKLGLISNIPDKTPLFYYFTSQTPKIKGKTEANSTVHFVYGSHDYTTSADSSGNYTVDIPELPRQYVSLDYYAIDQSGNRSETRKLNLTIGEENFPQTLGEQTGTVTPTPSVSVSPTPGTSEQPKPIETTQEPQTYELLVVNQKGDPIRNTSVFIDDRKYTSNADGKVYLEKSPSSDTKVYVEVLGVKQEASINGSKIIVNSSGQKSISIWSWWLILLIIIFAFVGYKVFTSKK